MERYDETNSEHRAMLDDWYWRIRKTSDFRHCFHRSIGTPRLFAAHFASGVGLFFTASHSHFTSCLWLTPWFDGVEMGAWIERESRGVRSVITEINDTIRLTLSYAPFMLSCTIQPRVERLLRMMGATKVGEVEGAWDGETVRVYKLTRATFKGWQESKDER